MFSSALETLRSFSNITALLIFTSCPYKSKERAKALRSGVPNYILYNTLESRLFHILVLLTERVKMTQIPVIGGILNQNRPLISSSFPGVRPQHITNARPDPQRQRSCGLTLRCVWKFTAITGPLTCGSLRTTLGKTILTFRNASSLSHPNFPSSAS